MSVLPWVFGKNARATPDKFCNVEDQAEVWDQTQKLGHELSQRVKSQTLM